MRADRAAMIGVIDAHRGVAARLLRRSRELKTSNQGRTMYQYARELEKWAGQNERYAEWLSEQYAKEKKHG